MLRLPGLRLILRLIFQQGDRMKKNKAVFSLLLICTVFLSQTGCSLLVPATRNFSVTSSTEEAEIYVNGQFIGKTAGSIVVPRNQSIQIMAKKKGYQPTIRTINTKLSATGVWDIIGGSIFLVPFIGLLAPGAYDLEVHNVNVILAEDDDKE